MPHITLCVSPANQVWSTGILYIPVKGGFIYLSAVMDVSNTLYVANCIELLEECIRLHGTAEIVNSDQGVQYTGLRWISLLQEHDIKISMDGGERFKDNI